MCGFTLAHLRSKKFQVDFVEWSMHIEGESFLSGWRNFVLENANLTHSTEFCARIQSASGVWKIRTHVFAAHCIRFSRVLPRPERLSARTSPF